MAKLIPLTRGKFAIVDDEDFERLSRFHWQVKERRLKGWSIFYAARSEWTDGKNRHIQMHRELMRFPKYLKIDHINGNGMDNRRTNLRFANNSQNVAHARKTMNCSSKYKGVHWHKGISKWVARITTHGLMRHLGCFTDELSAASTYDRAAIKFFGEFALTNRAMQIS